MNQWLCISLAMDDQNLIHLEFITKIKFSDFIRFGNCIFVPSVDVFIDFLRIKSVIEQGVLGVSEDCDFFIENLGKIPNHVS